MDITAAHTHIREILLQFLRHPLGQSGHQHPLVQFRTPSYLLQKVIHLILGRTHLNRRIKKSCRAHNLLDHKAFRPLQFVVCRSRADKHLLSGYRLELLELERSVVRSSRETEAIVHKYRLSRMVTAVHGPDLRQGHMTLINEGYEILREIVYQTERTHPLVATVEISRIVLYAGTISHLLDELQVIFHPLLETLGLQMLSDLVEVLALGHHIVLDLADGLRAPLLGGHEIAGRIYGYLVDLFQKGTGHRVDYGNLLHIVAEELNAHGVLTIAYADVHSVTPHTECSAFEISLSA